MAKSNQVTSVQNGKITTLSRLRDLADELERMDAKAGKYKADETKEVTLSMLDRLGHEHSNFDNLESKYGYHNDYEGALFIAIKVKNYHVYKDSPAAIQFFDDFVRYLVVGSDCPQGYDLDIVDLIKQLRL